MSIVLSAATLAVVTGGIGLAVTPGSTLPGASLHPVTVRAPGAPPAVTGGTPFWTWPLAPRPTVEHRFRAPTSPYGPGHRGIDLVTTTGARVLAVADGRVAHVGVVAGRGTVSIVHTDGLRSTYEPVTASVRRGERVRSGEVIGAVSDGPDHCRRGTCLHLGARVGEEYRDPLALLAPTRVILLPMHR